MAHAALEREGNFLYLRGMETAPFPTLSTVPSRRRGLSAFLLAFLPPLLYKPLGAAWALTIGLLATAWACSALIQGLVYSHAHRGKRWAALGLALAGATTYLAVGDL